MNPSAPNNDNDIDIHGTAPRGAVRARNDMLSRGRLG